MNLFGNYKNEMEAIGHLKNRVSTKSHKSRNRDLYLGKFMFGKEFLRCIGTLVIITGCIYLSACSNSNQQGEIPVLDLTKTYPEMEFVADEANKEYIVLETTDNVLADRDFSIQLVSEKHIVGINGNKGDVFIFNRNGKIKSFFNNKGEGSNEYLNLSSIVFDEKAQEVFIADFRAKNRCLVYDLDGRFLRQLNYPDTAWINDLYDFDEHNLLAYCTRRARPTDAPEDINQTMPYVFLSKKDGSVISRLDLSFQERVNDRIRVQTEQGLASIVIYTGAYKVRFGKEFIVSDKSSDTIYMFSQDKKLIPLFIRTPSVFNEEQIIILTVEFKTDTYLFFSTVNYDKNKITAQFLNNQEMTIDPEKKFAYNLHTGQLFSLSNIPSGINSAPNNTAIRKIYSFRLLEDLENGKLDGKLKQVAQKVDADDNPIVEIIKY